MLQSNLNNLDLPAENPGNDGGIYLHDLARGAVVEIETQHHNYRLVKRSDAQVRISGHPQFCPDPIDVEFEGSFGSKPPLMPNPGYIGRGMYLMFKHPVFDHITTSRIREIHKLS